MIIRLFIFMTLFFIVTPSAMAAENKAFNSYITKNDAYKTDLLSYQSLLTQKAFPTCTEQPALERRLVPIILAEPKVRENNPSEGQWIERAVFKTCGNDIQINVLTIGFSDESLPTFFPSLNGQTKIDPIDQPHALNAINVEMGNRKISQCATDPIIKDTKFLGFRGPNGKSLVEDNQNTGWFEQWSIALCDKNVDVTLAVLPDPERRYRYIARIKN